MKELISKIKTLEKSTSVFEPNYKERRSFNSKASDWVHKFIKSLKNDKSYSQKLPDSSFFKIDNQPKEIVEILKIFEEQVNQTGLKPASGGHLGYIPGGGIYAAAIADYLAAVSNEYAGLYFGSPGAVTIENEVLNWLKSVFRFPEDAVGNLTSGGSIANLIGLTAARDAFKIEDEAISNSVIYLSPQTHHCIHKALKVIGLKNVILRELELDAGHRINVDYLKKCIQVDKQSGLKPFCIIASAGTTDTGAIDPLEDIGNIANENNIWYHVDAAYGGFFILTDSKKQSFNGIEKADSLVIDPHKSMFLPYGVGAVLIKNKSAVLQSNQYIANYMKDAYQDEMQLNPADLSPELTKHFRGLRVWLPLQMYGTAPFKNCLEEKLLLTTYFRNKLKEAGFKVGPIPDLSVSYFWLPNDDLEKQNEMNRQLMKLIHENGSVFLSSTTLNDMFVIRIAILSFRTKLATIDKAIEMILDCKSKIQ